MRGLATNIKTDNHTLTAQPNGKFYFVWKVVNGWRKKYVKIIDSKCNSESIFGVGTR